MAIARGGSCKPSSPITVDMTTSTRANMRRSALESKCVFCKLIITKLPCSGFPFFRTVFMGMFPAGRIRRLVPMTIAKSAFLWWMSALAMASSGRGLSQSTVQSNSAPPHGLSQKRPVGFSPIPLTSVDRMYCLAQTEQRSANMFPCSSAKNFRGRPERRCNPSTFWLMTNLQRPSLTRRAMAMCVMEGTAASKLTARGGGRPSSSHVHTPSGPRKSGMPQAVEMPAPVCTTMWWLSRISRANSTHYHRI